MSREQTASAHISIGGAMKPSKLYSRDYNLLLSEEKKKKAEYLRQITEVDILKIKPMEYYPHAVRHNLDMFLWGIGRTGKTTICSRSRIGRTGMWYVTAITFPRAMLRQYACL